MSERWVYLIEVIGDDGDDHYYSGPVADHDRTFLVDHLLPTLQPLTAQDYLRGPARILLTAARSSYIVHGEQVYWCSEWQPGLVVLRFDPDGSLAWTAVRSPVPNFGGRDPLPGDSTDFDEDAENNLYNLIFDPWDASSTPTIARGAASNPPTVSCNSPTPTPSRRSTIWATPTRTGRRTGQAKASDCR